MFNQDFRGNRIAFTAGTYLVGGGVVRRDGRLFRRVHINEWVK